MKLFLYFLRYTYKDYARQKGFMTTVIVTMSLALVAFMLVSTLMYTVLYKTLPYQNSDSLIVVNHHLINDEQEEDGNAFIYPNLEYLYLNQTVIEHGTMVYLDADVITSHKEQPTVQINYVTPEWFSLFPTNMLMGRVFTESEKRNSYHPVAILTFDTWQRQFSGNDEILGQSLTFGGRTYQIVGVLPKNYQAPKLLGPWSNPGLYIPWDFNSVSDYDRKAWGNDDSSLMFVGSLLGESSLVQSNQLLTSLVNGNWQQQVASDSFFKGWSINVSLTPLKRYMVGSAEKSIQLLSIGIIGLVIISFINIANLFAANQAAQSQNMAIAAAIGAKKNHIGLQVLAQALMLMVAAFLIALLISYMVLPWLSSLLASYLPRAGELSIYLEVVLVALLLAVLIAFGLAAIASRAINYRQLQRYLNGSGKGTGIQVSASIRKTMISMQVAVASILLFINMSLVSDGVSILNQPLGYQPENRSFAVLAVPNANQSLQANIMKNVISAIEELPMVVGVSQALRPSSFGLSGMVSEITNKSHSFQSKGVDHNYFSMMEYEFINGDDFTQGAFDNHERLAIVNQSLADQLARDGEVLGYSFTNGLRVVGVVKDIFVPGERGTTPRIYTLTLPSRNMMIIQTLDNQPLSRSLLVETIKKVSTQLSLFSYESLSENRDNRLLLSRTTIYSAIAITFITILLSLVGLYGVFNMTSLMRQNELATRMALGAKRMNIVRLMLGDNIKLVALGLSISLVMGLGLYGSGAVLPIVVGVDHVSFCLLSTVLLVFIILLIATYLPLRSLFKQPLRSLMSA